jgi:membrane protein DedA with SNARE-associated domain
LQSYGYYAVFLFACIEGELAVLTAGFFCRSGVMSLELVILFAFLGTFLTEQILYFVGRIYGTKLLKKYPTVFKKSEKILEFLRNYNSAFIFGSRFIYGIRNISPIIIGIANISPGKFSSLNIPAALIWAILVASAGYLFADALDFVSDNMKIIQIVFLAALVTGAAFLIFKKSKRRK